MSENTILHGDCLHLLPTLSANSACIGEGPLATRSGEEMAALVQALLGVMRMWCPPCRVKES